MESLILIPRITRSGNYVHRRVLIWEVFNIFKDINKKAFQSNANRLLADSMGYIVNKYEHAQGEGAVEWGPSWTSLKMSKGGALYSEVSVEQVKHVWGVSWDPVRGPLVDKKNCSGIKLVLSQEMKIWV